MKKIIVAAAVAFAFLMAPFGGEWSDAKAGYEIVKVKKCLFKKKCDYKVFVKRTAGPSVVRLSPGPAPRSAAAPVVVTDETGKKSLVYRGFSFDRVGENILGTAVGGVISTGVSGWLFQPKAPPPPQYAPPPPPPQPQQVVVQRPVVVQQDVVISPWTPDWYDYCANRYKSFDARTGYYTTHGGGKRFCQ